jgi:hypothetical protein
MSSTIETRSFKKLSYLFNLNCILARATLSLAGVDHISSTLHRKLGSLSQESSNRNSLDLNVVFCTIDTINGCVQRSYIHEVLEKGFPSGHV